MLFLLRGKLDIKSSIKVKKFICYPAFALNRPETVYLAKMSTITISYLWFSLVISNMTLPVIFFLPLFSPEFFSIYLLSSTWIFMQMYEMKCYSLFSSKLPPWTYYTNTSKILKYGFQHKTYHKEKSSSRIRNNDPQFDPLPYLLGRPHWARESAGDLGKMQILIQ